MNLILILIGIGLVLGAFYTAWLFWKIADRVENEKQAGGRERRAERNNK